MEATGWVQSGAVVSGHVRRRCCCSMKQRRCSRCGELGHNARTCKAEYFRQPNRRSTVAGWLRCPMCGGSGVLPCRSCSNPVEGDSPTVMDLCTLSKFHYKMRGEKRAEICPRCGGSSLIVCSQCVGMSSTQIEKRSAPSRDSPQ